MAPEITSCSNPTSSVSDEASKQATVQVISQVSVGCMDPAALATAPTPFRLGPMDDPLFMYMPLDIFYIYRKDATSDSVDDELVPVARFERALRRVLDYYPHLTGRLGLGPHAAPQITKLGAGVSFITAECNLPVSAFDVQVEPGSKPRLIATSLPESGNALLPTYDAAKATEDPVLTVQHTRFACGGVAIAFRVRHVMCDGAGMFQLTNNLAEIYRGFRDLDLGLSSEIEPIQLQNPPQIHAYFSELELTPEEQEEALKEKPSLFDLGPEEALVGNRKETEAPPPFVCRILRFSADELAALKRDANADESLPKVSTFTALTAHIFQSLFRARINKYEAQAMTLNEVLCQLLIACNARSRGQLDVSPNYFSNCVLYPVFSMTADRVRNSPLSTIAAWVNEQIQPMDQKEVKKSLRWVVAQPDRRRIAMPYNHSYEGLHVSQWSKFDMYRGGKLDISPALVAQPLASMSYVDGQAYYLATEDQLDESADMSGISTGSIDVSLNLFQSIWDILDQDPSFRRYRGW